MRTLVQTVDWCNDKAFAPVKAQVVKGWLKMCRLSICSAERADPAALSPPRAMLLHQVWKSGWRCENRSDFFLPLYSKSVQKKAECSSRYVLASFALQQLSILQWQFLYNECWNDWDALGIYSDIPKKRIFCHLLKPFIYHRASEAVVDLRSNHTNNQWKDLACQVGS